MSSSKNQNYLHGAAILAAAVLIVKVLGAIYKIPMGNILGDEGFAHFNVAYSLYNVVLALSTAGLPVALSKMISAANSLDQHVKVKKIYKVSMISFVTLGAIGTLAMLFFSTELAVFMEDVEASQSVFAMAPSILLVCIMSAHRGYTQGLSDMRPTSISQIIEVAAKVFFGLLMVIILQKMGYSLPILAAGAISGVSVGSLVACLYTGYVSRKREKEENAIHSSDSKALDVGTNGQIVKELFKIGVPIALGSCIHSIITLVNTKLILGRLQSGAGFSFEEAKVLFGVYSKALTLYNLPAAIITPMTISIIPAISGYLAMKKNTEAKEVTESSLRISTILALPMAVGLSALAGAIMDGLYYGSAQEGHALLAMMGIASFFVCLALMTTAMLQASGKERLPMISMIVGGGLNIILNWLLIGNDSLNIYGAPIGTLVSYMTMGLMNLYFVMKNFPEKPNLKNVFLKPTVNCVIMGACAWLIYPAFLKVLGAGVVPSRMMVLCALGITVIISIVVYGVLTITTRSITMDDMKLLPKGEKLANLLHIK